MKYLFVFLTACTLTAPLCSNAQAPKVRLNHIAVHVTNLEKSIFFYHTVIGLDTLPEPFHDGKHCWLSTGAGSQLHLIAGAAALQPPGKNNHTCFSVASVPEFVQKLKQYNIAYENWAGETSAVTTRPDGVHQVYFKDPDGYWIEINDAR